MFALVVNMQLVSNCQLSWVFFLKQLSLTTVETRLRSVGWKERLKVSWKEREGGRGRVTPCGGRKVIGVYLRHLFLFGSILAIPEKQDLPQWWN